MAGKEPHLCLALFQPPPTSRRQPTFSIIIGWIHPNLFGELYFAYSVLPKDWDVPEEHSSAADPQRRHFSGAVWDGQSVRGVQRKQISQHRFFLGIKDSRLRQWFSKARLCEEKLVCVCVCVCVYVRCVMSDSCNPMGCSPPGSSDHGISPARILDWAAIFFSRACLEKHPCWAPSLELPILLSG